MKFLIVVPRFVDVLGQPYHFPVGLSYISASLKHYGYQVECLNLNHYSEPVSELLDWFITKKKIDVVCTGGLSVHYNKVKEIVYSACEVKRDIITLVGGGLISSEPELMLKDLKFSYGVIGEGELTIVELAEALSNQRDPQDVNGIIYINANKEVTLTPARKPIMDLTTIPWPDYAGMEIEKYLASQMPGDQFYRYHFDSPREFPIISSRSCPYCCTFCYHPLGNKYRQRPLDDFFQELDSLVPTYGINLLVIMDEVFALRRDRVEEFCQRIKNHNLKWIPNLRVDAVDKALLEMMREAGCFYVGYGVESASDTVLKSMKKNITLSQIEKALKETKEVRLGIQANLIFGDPAETIETVEESLNWYTRHPEYQINLGLIQMYPGTKLYREAIERGLIKDRLKFIADGCPPLNMTYLTDEQYMELSRLVYELPGKFLILPNHIYCEKRGTVKHRGDVFYLKIKCPYCQTFVEYHNMNRLPGFSRLGCKACNQRFFMPREIFDQAAAKYQVSPVAPIFLAHKAMAGGDLTAARAILEEAIGFNPGDPELYIHLGRIYFRSGQTAQAEKSFRQCLTLDPQNLRAHLILALLVRSQGRLDEAELLYDDAIQFHPNDAELWVARGRLALERDEKPVAKVAFQRALALEPSRNDILLELNRLSQ